MISKLHIDQVACFKKPTMLETDKKVNLIYGLNGTGKSTLSGFLHNRTHSKYRECSVEGLEKSDMMVYNQIFIQENFHESPDLKGIFTLSKENKEAKTKIDQSEKEIARIDNELLAENAAQTSVQTALDQKVQQAKTKIWEIKSNYSGGDRVLEYCLEGYKSDGFKLLSYMEKFVKSSAKPAKTIDKIKEEVQSVQGDDAQTYPLIPTLTFGGKDVETSPLMKKQIVGSNTSSIGDFINQLGNSDWVKEGFRYLPNEDKITKTENCPFCQTASITRSLLLSLTAYFDESYEQDVRRIRDLEEKYSNEITEIPTSSNFESNKIFQSFKKDYELRYQTLVDIFRKNKKLMDDKIKSPSLAVTLNDSSTAFRALVEIIESVNVKIDDNNRKIADKSKSLLDLKNSFWNIMAWEYAPTTTALASERAASATASKSITSKIAQLRIARKKEEAIIIEQQKMTINISEAIDNINQGLVDLGIDDFKIAKYANDLYRISRTTEMQHVFLSLSEGEKMIISFLYFMETCKGKKSASDAGNKKIVVIDDPISSLSHIFIFNIGRLIKNEFLKSQKYEQVFILTHSLYFFYELTETNHEKRKDDQKLFRLRKNSEGSEIMEMKYEEIQNDYHSYWHIIKDSKQPASLIANCMRNIIEYFFNFVEKTDVNATFQKKELKNNRFDAFNRYINRESHSLGQNIFDLKEFNYDDFKLGFELVFTTTGYEDHYKKMIS